MPNYQGGCLCGAVRYICEAEASAQGACHCRDCQYIAGGGAAHALTVPTDAVQMTQGAPVAHAKLSDAGNRVTRFFCGACGTHLFLRNAAHPDRTSVNAGTLDDTALYSPHGHMWVESAPRWHRLEADLSRLLREAA
ncbi:MAG: GFA family protein [Hyphomicrobiales bacterium]|nr:GFA family protein [Hyphomicrobiales bacterium]